MSIYRALVEKPPPFRPVLLGYREDGSAIELEYEKHLQYHTQLMGLSGRGKSRLIEHILRQFLINEVGFTLIDPHGDIYPWILAFLERQRPSFLKRRKIHLFDPAHPRWRFAYNPVHVPEDVPDELRDAYVMDRIDAIMEAVAQVMGGEDIDAMPLFQRTFSTVLYALAERGLSMGDAFRMLPVTEDAFREFITAELPDPVAAATAREMNAWSARDFTTNMGSLFSRMHRLLRHPFIRQILSQTDNVLDVKELMDNGEVLLVNLQPRHGLTHANAQLLGRLLLSDYIQVARSRVANESRPHFLVIDEAYRFLTDDIPDYLVETRKFGVHLMLAHHALYQLGKPGEPIYEGVLGGAQSKVFFGVDYEDALVLAQRFFAHEFTLERPVEALVRPLAVGVERDTVRGKSRTEMESGSWNSGTATMQGAVASYGAGVGTSYDVEGNPISSSSSSSGGGADISSFVEAAGVGGGYAVGTSESEQEVFKPIYKELPTAVHSRDDERHFKAVEMARQHTQDFIARFADLTSYSGVTVSFDRVPPRFDRLMTHTEKLFEADLHNVPVDEVVKAIEERARLLDELVRKFHGAPELTEAKRYDPDDFFT